MPKYDCEYTYTVQWGNPRHTWSVVGARGGVHLHITDLGEERDKKCLGTRYSGGIEIHSRTPTTERAPDHKVCWLLGCPCWHDGSSLTASEIWIPRWQRERHNHDRMFRLLEAEVERWFTEVERWFTEEDDHD